MDTPQNLNLPYILPSQAQKHVTHNEAPDAVAQIGVQTRIASEPPAAPAARGAAMKARSRL
ncbi:MAG: hypothetical protein KKC43_03470 [Alphaproteobacteria bacterium]|nr:hypothetical protein [Alphaproteobacteria bacterium]